MAARKLQCHAGERFQVTCLAGADLPDSLGNRSRLSAFAGIQGKQAVRLTPVGMAEDDCFHAEGTLLNH
jgi:hypothetical protein